jgi:hypothetical protein
MDTYLVQDPREYDFQAASWIAQEHAQGDTLLQLHQAHPETVPAPMTVKRWRREFPAFDLLMLEAEHARADCLVDQTLDIADSDDRTAGAARNSIQARQWAASRLNQARYGQKSVVDGSITHGGTVKHESMSVYSDDDLQAIIRAGVKADALEGESKRIETATPGAPPGEETVGLEQEYGADPPAPKISADKPSVTTNKPHSMPIKYKAGPDEWDTQKDTVEVGPTDPLKDTTVGTPLPTTTDDKPEF